MLQRLGRPSASLDVQNTWQVGGIGPETDARAPTELLSHGRVRSGNKLALVIKRVFDQVSAVILIWLSLPLLVLIAALVAMDGGPVFYMGKRVGLGGISFKCIKFRTMIPDAELCLEEYLSHHPTARAEWENERKLTFDPRITSVGNFLRRASLDELPQLFNVVKGEMSLVGPRPVTTSELAYYGKSAALYESVRPGMTGLWQVSGRSEVSYATRVALDTRYVFDWSLGLDLWILFRTPAVVLSKRGAK